MKMRSEKCGDLTGAACKNSTAKLVVYPVGAFAAWSCIGHVSLAWVTRRGQRGMLSPAADAGRSDWPYRNFNRAIDPSGSRFAGRLHRGRWRLSAQRRRQAGNDPGPQSTRGYRGALQALDFTG